MMHAWNPASEFYAVTKRPDAPVRCGLHDSKQLTPVRIGRKTLQYVTCEALVLDRTCILLLHRDAWPLSRLDTVLNPCRRNCQIAQFRSTNSASAGQLSVLMPL